MCCLQREEAIETATEGLGVECFLQTKLQVEKGSKYEKHRERERETWELLTSPGAFVEQLPDGSS